MAVRRATTTDAATPAIESLGVSDDRLDVRWDDGHTSAYPWLWLRDHAHDEATLHPVTQQRQLYTAGIAPDLRGVGAQVVVDDVAVTWNDDTPPSRLPIEFLARFRRPRSARAAVDVERVLWDAEVIAEQWPTVPYESVIDGDEGVAAWLLRVATYGFCVVEGTPATVEASQRLIRLVGYIRETIFGGFWDFQADLAKADTAYTNLELLPHTDGTYSHDAPGPPAPPLPRLRRHRRRVDDGRRVPDRRRACGATSPITTRSSSSVAVPGQYIGDGSHLVAARPVFRHDDTGLLVQVSFNNADRAPFLLPADEMTRFYDAMRAFEARGQRPRDAVAARAVTWLGDALRQLARPARPDVVHRPSSPVRRLCQPRGLREPSPLDARALKPPTSGAATARRVRATTPLNAL